MEEMENQTMSEETMSEQTKSGTKSRRPNVFGWLLVAAEVIVMAAFGYLLLKLDLLPKKQLLGVMAIMGILLLFSVLSQIFRHGRAVGKIYTLLVLVIFGMGSFYLFRTNAAFASIQKQTTTVVSRISLVVMKDTDYVSMSDVSDCTFGLQENVDTENINQAVRTLQSQYGKSVQSQTFENYEAAAEALYNGEIEVMALNEAYRDTLLDTYPTFTDDTRTLTEFTYEREVKVETNETVVETGEPFVVFLSGNDSYGTVSTENGRTDVNILAVVNPSTKQVLLVTTPRDYYIDLPVGDYYYKDKLTHAGIYGIDVSERVLSELYDVDINYYVRINFSGFSSIVDALGGVTVHSDYNFTDVSGAYTFVVGDNYVDGDAALAFVRERYAFSDGDYQRGRNQMYMIQAIINKVTSPAILTSYLNLLDSLSDCFVTDVPTSKITELVKMQLADNAEWSIENYETKGYGNMLPTYSQGGAYASVQEINQESVDEAKALIQKVLNGESLADTTSSSDNE